MNRDTHKGWLIEQDWIGRYVATHPDFDPPLPHRYEDFRDDMVTKMIEIATKMGD